MKIMIVGHFGLGFNLNNGQTVKTKNLYDELVKKYGDNEVGILDTYNWKKNPIGLFFRCINCLKKADNVIVLPAHKGVRVFIPLFVKMNKIYKKKLFYVVIGGWLPEFLKTRKYLKENIKKLSMIFVETMGMKNRLNDIGVSNVDILLNFKDITILNENDLIDNKNDVFKVCTFSRVIKEKGIENAINAINIVNDKCGKKIYELDVYGPVSLEYKEEFESLLLKNKNIVNYMGVVPAGSSVEIIKDYKLLLFPTNFVNEGIPGTVIDAFSAGVPVVASDWKYSSEMIVHGENGFIFEMKNDLQLSNILLDIYNNKYDLGKIRKKCLSSALKYSPEVAISNLIKYLDD